MKEKIISLSTPIKKNKDSLFSRNIIIFLVCLFCIGFVIKSSAYLSHILSTTKTTISTKTANIISNTIGKSMQKDIYGNINILLVWYGGAKHQWWFLADSIIVTSFDPKEYSVSMISIPRDLVINSSGYINRVNTVMAYSYNKNKDLDLAVQSLSNKVSEITSLDIPYYALIDFNGFADLVDKIWGIDVYVPKKVYDSTYPGPNYSYTIFSINSGQQHLDGTVALKYARSRHSSSDFSRSQRQQLIIKALIEKMTNQGLSITTMNNVYETYKEYVHTNITLDEMLGLLAYGSTIPEMHSFGLTMECSNNSRKTMQAWCFLYPVDSTQFGWMSGILPIWASIGKISYYDLIHGFTDLISHHQWYLNEKSPIRIYNAIDKTYARKFAYRDQIANKLWAKLKKYGFIVNQIENAVTPLSWTTIIVTGTGEYKNTIESLKLFFPIDSIQLNPATVDLSGNALPNSVDIYLGNTFADQFASKPFNFYLPNAQQYNTQKL